ncbi:MAG: hypothetical protein EOP34_10480, partial [Rickettsiales bacterium]
KEWLNLDEDEMDQLLLEINKNSSITDLCLILIEDQAKKALLLKKIYTFLKTSNIKTLDLTYNRIGAAGAKALAVALAGNTTLVKLDLIYNNIGAEGARALAGALKGNTTLVKLDLTLNNIGDNGANHLAGAIESQKTLVELDLSNNRIGAEGIGYIASAIDHNKNILYIYIFGAESRVIEEKLEKNREDVKNIVDKIVKLFPDGNLRSLEYVLCRNKTSEAQEIHKTPDAALRVIASFIDVSIKDDPKVTHVQRLKNKDSISR